MKRLIAIALALMALTSFGSQQTQAAEAREKHILEMQRARVERIKREIERAGRVERVERVEVAERAGRPERFEISKIYYQASAEAYERNIKAIMDLKKKILERNIFKTPYYNCPQTPTEVKQKKPRKKPRNSLMSYDTRRENNRFEKSGPARRRK